MNQDPSQFRVISGTGGLAVLARKRNTKAVIATLWEVADPNTARVMEAFYRERALNKVDKAEALRRAQVRLFKGDGNGNPHYAHT